MTNLQLLFPNVSKIFEESVNKKTQNVTFTRELDSFDKVFKEVKSAEMIERIVLVFHNTSFQKFRFPFSSDYKESFLIFLRSFKYLKHLDFAGCDTLAFQEWRTFFQEIEETLPIKVGASLDKTGNLSYGGNWDLENTRDNLKELYWTDAILEYASLLSAAVEYTFLDWRSDTTVPGTPIIFELTDTYGDGWGWDDGSGINYTTATFEVDDNSVSMTLASGPGPKIYYIRVDDGTETTYKLDIQEAAYAYEGILSSNYDFTPIVNGAIELNIAKDVVWNWDTINWAEVTLGSTFPWNNSVATNALATNAINWTKVGFDSSFPWDNSIVVTALDTSQSDSTPIWNTINWARVAFGSSFPWDNSKATGAIDWTIVTLDSSFAITEAATSAINWAKVGIDDSFLWDNQIVLDALTKSSLFVTNKTNWETINWARVILGSTFPWDIQVATDAINWAQVKFYSIFPWENPNVIAALTKSAGSLFEPNKTNWETINWAQVTFDYSSFPWENPNAIGAIKWDQVKFLSTFPWENPNATGAINWSIVSFTDNFPYFAAIQFLLKTGGPPGPAGADGEDGEDGQDGEDGAPCATGSKTVTYGLIGGLLGGLVISLSLLIKRKKNK